MTNRQPRGFDVERARKILFRIWDNVELRIPIEGSYFNYILDENKPQLPDRNDPLSPPISLWRINGKARRRRARTILEGGPAIRRRQLEFLYKRDRGMCYNCGMPVLRYEASREHLLPIREYPHLARDRNNMALVHITCNT